MKIETNIPMPEAKAEHGQIINALRGLAKARVGDSILFPRKSVASLNGNAHRAGAGKWFTMRVEDGGVRVWKTAEPKTMV